MAEVILLHVYYIDRFGDVCDDSSVDNRPAIGKVVCSMLRRSFVNLRAEYSTGSAGIIILALQIISFGNI